MEELASLDTLLHVTNHLYHGGIHAFILVTSHASLNHSWHAPLMAQSSMISRSHTAIIQVACTFRLGPRSGLAV